MRRTATFTGAIRTPSVTFSAVALLLIMSAAMPGRTFAQHAQPAHASRPAAVTETGKVTLGETSIAGPALIGAQGIGFAIAWTGTDAAHHLNFRTGTTNLSVPNKTTLPETSPFGPAMSEVPTSGRLFPFAVAWTGTDANHSLNVQIFTGGAAGQSGPKLTLHETSIAAPALAFADLNGTSKLLLAWTGTDANHSLNVLPLTFGNANTLIPGTKTVLPQFSSSAGPSLSDVVLGWSARATQQLNLAVSTDAVHFTSASGSGLPQTSAFAPQFSQSSATNACIAWTGTDATHHLNVQCAFQFPPFPAAATKTVLSETAAGAPSFTITSFTNADIAWTGTDAAHHLNVASLQGA
jgi:hypothetical protein